MDGSGYVPLLATAEPACSTDGLTCTITLQKNVKFHDGTPFNAAAVKYTLEKIKDPAYGSARASIAASINSITVIDDYTVELALKYPDGVLLAKLAHTNSAIVSPTAEASSDLMVSPVGTGPFKFVSYVSVSEVKLTRNEDYWGEKTNIKDVTMTIVKEDATAISRLETGEADFLAAVPVAQVDRVKAISTAEVYTKEGGAITYLGIRTTSSINEVTKDKNLRLAIAYAINRQAWVDSLDGYAVFSNSVIGPKIFGYTAKAEEFGFAYDLEKAKSMVVEGGFADEKLVFTFSNTSMNTTLAELVQSNLKEAGFTNVVLNPLEFATYLTETNTENTFDIGLFAWSNVTGDGSELLEPNFSTTGTNRIRYVNADFDALVQQSKKTLDKAARITALEAANKMILEDVAVVPLYNSFLIYAASKKVLHVEMDPGGIFYVNDFVVTE
ncbi:MAG: glutathione ABC transporter substrate-binding protein [Erysipelotrichales bacterium]|nr:MAG: glutathione ABC transporter substrate-binding protein [Erysipelotrichales bacterium]